MKIHDVTALAIKLAGLVLLVILLTKIPEYVNSYLSYPGSEHPYNYLFYILPLFIVGVACALLIIFPYTISNRLLFNNESISSPEIINKIQTIAIRLLAILLLFWSMSDLVFHFFVYFLYHDVIEPSFSAGTYDYPSMYATVAEFAFACILLLRAKTISLHLTSVSK